MTTATNPGNYVDFDEYVGLKLDKTRSTIRTTDLLTALAGVAAMFLGYLLIFVVFDQWVVRDGFGVVWRWVLLSTLMICTVGWLVWKVGIPSFRTVNGLFAAREIEKSEPELKSNLLNLIDLKAAGRTVNPAILKAMERQAAVRLQQVDVGQAIDHRPLVRTAYALLAVIILFCFYALLSPKKISNSIWRGLLPSSNVSLATITEILDVKPGDITVPAHQSTVDVQVDLAGEIPAQVWLYYSTVDGKKDLPVELRPEQEGQTRFKGQLIGDGSQGLTQDLTYFVRAGDASSRQYKITVEQPPYAEIETVRIEFPGYMKLQPIEQTNNGVIDAWEGAKIQVTAKTNMVIRSAVIQFLDDPQVGPSGEEIIATVSSNGRQIQAQWTLGLRSDGTFPKCYRIHCRTELGKVTTGHVLYPMTIQPDLPPEVALLQPDRDFEAPVNATIPLLIQVRDPDFEIGYVYLNVEKGGLKTRGQISEGRESKLNIKHELVLAKLNAQVGDDIDIWVEAYDNKQPRPNSRNTPKVRIHVVQPVSEKEADQQLAEQKERREQKIAETDPETNPDQATPGQQKDGDPHDRQAKNDDRTSDKDPKQQEHQRRDPQDNSQDNSQDQRQPKNANNSERSQRANPREGSDQTSGSQKSGGDKNHPDKNLSDPSQSQSSEGTKREKPLSTEGSQDEQILRKLNEHLNKKNPPKPNEATEPPASENTEQQNSGNDSEKDPKKQSPDKPSADNERTNEGQGSESKKPDGPEQKKTKPTDTPDSTDESEPSTDSPGAKNQSADKTTPDNAQPNSETPPPGEKKPSKKPRQGETPDAKNEKSSDQHPKSTQQKSGTDKPSGTEQKPAGEKSETNNRDQKQTAKPETNGSAEKNPSSDTEKMNQEGSPQPGAQTDDPEKNTAGKPGEQNPSGSDPKDADKTGTDPKIGEPDAAKPEPKPNQKDDGSAGKSEVNQEKPGEAEGSKSLPTGLNKAAPKQSPTESGTAKKPKNSKDDPDSKAKGPREQAPDAPNARPEKADGTEEGVGKPDRDSKNKPAPVKTEKVTRDPNEKPEVRPGTAEQDSPKPEKSPKEGDKPKSTRPKEKTPKNQKDQDHQPPAVKPEEKMDGPEGGTQPNEDGATESSKPESGDQSKAEDGKEQGDPKSSQKAGNGGKKKGGEKKSGEPSQGSESDSTNSKTEEKSGEKPSTDKKSDPQGDQSANEEKGGGDDENEKAGNEKKPSKESSKGGDKAQKSGQVKNQSGKDKSGKSGDEGKSQGEGDGKKPGKGQGNTPPKGSGSSAKPGGEGNNNGNGGGTNSDATSQETHGGDTPEAELGEEANLEYNRQATELILQKLKRELDRGEVDQDLLDQLGWTPADMKRFADRLSQSLSESKLGEDTPESKARQQQFQEMLKSLDLQKSGTQRSGDKEPKRDVSQIESKRSAPPPAYRSAFEKFTRDMARQKKPASDKPAK